MKTTKEIIMKYYPHWRSKDFDIEFNDMRYDELWYSEDEFNVKSQELFRDDELINNYLYNILSKLQLELESKCKQIAELSSQYDESNELWYGMDTSLGKSLPSQIQDIIDEVLNKYIKK